MLTNKVVAKKGVFDVCSYKLIVSLWHKNRLQTIFGANNMSVERLVLGCCKRRPDVEELRLWDVEDSKDS